MNSNMMHYCTLIRLINIVNLNCHRRILSVQNRVDAMFEARCMQILLDVFYFCFGRRGVRLQ